MISSTVQSPDKTRYKEEIGRFFGQLSPLLFRQALNVKNTITSLDKSQSGYWQDILTAEDAQPWLRIHGWLLETYQFPSDLNRETLDKNLYLAMYFSYLNFWLTESIRNKDTIFDEGYRPLAHSFQRQSKQFFQQILPLEDHPFWQDMNDILQARQAALSWLEIRQIQDDTRFDTADWHHYANILSPLKLGATALLHLIDKSENLPDILRMIDMYNQAYRIQQDILAIRRDLLRGHLTYPIMRTMTLAGTKVKRPFNVESFMGAAILTGSVKKVCAEAIDRLQQSREIAENLSIKGWVTYCDQLQQSIESLKSLFSLRAGSENGRQSHRFLPYRDMAGQSLKMAEGYLLADPGFKESIEINRGGLEQLEEARGIIFPYSFITYLLLENGHDLSRNVEVVFSEMERLGYRYYENMAVAPDTDETAILLRLFKFSPNPEQHRQQLERPLRWLVNNIKADGSIPAFWSKVDIPVLERMVVWENYCLTAEVNTLLGLIDYDWIRFQALIERAATGLFGRYLESDFGTVAYYDPLYTLWQMLSLARQLEGRAADPELSSLISTSQERLSERVTIEARRNPATPQAAAFLILACLAGQKQAVLRHEWITFLHKTQRFDGSWNNEPFFITCDRDGLPGNWYSSRTMTTAFCYHALKNFDT